MKPPDRPPLPRSYISAMDSFYNARRARNKSEFGNAAEHSQQCLRALQAILVDPELDDINRVSILDNMAITALEAGFYDKVAPIIDRVPRPLSSHMEVLYGCARLLSRLPGWKVDWQARELDQSGADLVMTRDDLSVTILFDGDELGMSVKGTWPSITLSLPFEDNAISEVLDFITGVAK